MVSKNVKHIEKIFDIFFKVNWLLALVSLVSVLFLYFRLPQNVPMHMNIPLQIDGFGNKLGIFLIPFCLFVLGILIRIASQKYDSFFGKFNSTIKFFLVLFLLIVLIFCAKYLIIYFRIVF